MDLELQREYLDEANIHTGEAEQFVQLIADSVEDAGTAWGERVMKALTLLREANAELRVIKKQFNQNNPPQPREPATPFEGFKGI